MASCKVIRRLALSHHARGLCHKQDALQPDHLEPRSSLALLEALEEHVTSSGKQILAALKDLVWSEKIELAHQERLVLLLREARASDQIKLLRLEGRNDTRGLFEKMEQELAIDVGVTIKKGSNSWEAILNGMSTLRLSIEECTNIPAKHVVKQAAHCYTIYSVLSQHVHAGKVLAQLWAFKGKILFPGWPMSPEQVQIYLCIAKAANFDIVEESSSFMPC